MDIFEDGHDMDNLDIQRNEFLEYGDAFMTDEVFPTRDDLIQWVREIGYSQGFVMKISKSDHVGLHKRERATLVCERSGVYKASNEVLKYVTTSKKCNCPFKLYAKPCSIGEGWALSVKCGRHNHERHETMIGHPYPGRLTDEQKNLVINLTKDGVKPNRILNNLKQSYPNNCTTMPQIYNFRGFRSIALFRSGNQHDYIIVRYQLINEMKVHESLYKNILGYSFYDKTMAALHVDNIGSASREKWLELPDMGHVIATRYNVALVSIHHQHIWGCTTYLPLLKSPEVPPRIWAIGNVGGVHWVKLNLRPGAPLPPVYVHWKSHCHEDAKAWECILQHPLQLFRTLLPISTTDASIINIIED